MLHWILQPLRAIFQKNAQLNKKPLQANMKINVVTLLDFKSILSIQTLCHVKNWSDLNVSDHETNVFISFIQLHKDNLSKYKELFSASLQVNLLLEKQSPSLLNHK
ncbi:hypothetical protein XENOCAPTIV_009201 [Xenoophorus captivus]|uniref:Uncharacterized protein n=1 Tax=Xenoophorus captivus TaxID=1517983 RepID=A0ABV0RPS2_9TELE